MAKTCQAPNCNNPVFSNLFCRNHQWMRKDDKRPRPTKYVRKDTGELALFKEIWNERPHICEECGEPLQYFSHSLFHHKKGKGKYPELRLDKSNISLLCFTCHQNKH